MKLHQVWNFWQIIQQSCLRHSKKRGQNIEHRKIGQKLLMRVLIYILILILLMILRNLFILNFYSKEGHFKTTQFLR